MNLGTALMRHRIAYLPGAPMTVPTLELDGLTLMLLLIGLVPLAGLAVLGRWPEWELGAGTGLAFFALLQLARPR
jgi:hypothetical protein